MNRQLKYLSLTVFVLILGLLSRNMSAYTTDFVRTYLGDVLWAMMVYFGCRFLFVRAKKRIALGIALLFSYGIEVSQLYHAHWIDRVRAMTLGGLVLGFSFRWSDIVCYTAGIVIGVIVDALLSWSRK